ncbi:nuclear transport factor 2 family protein [soil metagenome]
MKKYFLSLSLFFISTITIAQTKDEQQLGAAVDTLIQAIIRADKPVLESLTADDLSYGHSSGKVESKKQFVDAVVNGSFDYLSGNTSAQTISITNNTGVVRHVFTFQYNNKGESGEMKIGVLLVWQKQKGKWKLLARQAFKL